MALRREPAPPICVGGINTVASAVGALVSTILSGGNSACVLTFGCAASAPSSSEVLSARLALACAISRSCVNGKLSGGLDAGLALALTTN